MYVSVRVLLIPALPTLTLTYDDFIHLFIIIFYLRYVGILVCRLHIVQLVSTYSCLSNVLFACGLYFRTYKNICLACRLFFLFFFFLFLFFSFGIPIGMYLSNYKDKMYNCLIERLPTVLYNRRQITRLARLDQFQPRRLQPRRLLHTVCYMNTIYLPEQAVAVAVPMPRYIYASIYRNCCCRRIDFLPLYPPSSIIPPPQNLNFLLADLLGSGGRLESVSLSKSATILLKKQQSRRIHPISSFRSLGMNSLRG